MEKILISACLIGDKTKYDGHSNYHPLIKKLMEKYDLVPFCPEVEGGLPIPRLPNEIKDKKVIRQDGKDVTHQFYKGAELAWNICNYLSIKIAILKDGSPSCGSKQIYDGSFSHKKIPGQGITASYLKSKGLIIYSEDEIEKLI